MFENQSNDTMERRRALEKRQTLQLTSPSSVTATQLLTRCKVSNPLMINGLSWVFIIIKIKIYVKRI